MQPNVVEIHGLCVDIGAGRPLLRDLALALGHDRVALVGRNGVGKTTLLQILAGERAPDRGSLVARVTPVFVRQHPEPAEVQRAAQRLLEHPSRDVDRHLAELDLDPALLTRPQHSRGEARKLLLLAARLAAPDLLLLDEPTEGLDEAGVAWLCRWLATWDRGAIVASHHRGLLRCFADFFVVAESGCSHVSGGYDELTRRLGEASEASERQYVRNLNHLDDQERRHAQILRRRARKKNVGRLHELDRCTSRMRLGAKRGAAQVSQARVAAIRDERISAARGWARATRRALAVELPLELPPPTLRQSDGQAIATLTGVGVTLGERPLFTGVDLRVGRDRLALVGPNGAGKTTLLRVLLGEQRPTTGRARCRPAHIGSIAQGATDWISDDSLIDRLLASSSTSLADAAALVARHRFPLALAARPLRSLSPGERVRAALVCLFERAPEVELLVLDEPSDGLDLVGLAALQRALRAWPGGLVVASHDHELLADLGLGRSLVLDGRGGHCIRTSR